MYVVKFLNPGYTQYIIGITQRYLKTKNLISGLPGKYHVHVKTVFVNIDIPRLSLVYNLLSGISMVYNKYITCSTLTCLFFKGSGADFWTQQASLLASTQTLIICNQCPNMTSLIPGRIRQPWKYLCHSGQKRASGLPSRAAPPHMSLVRTQICTGL